MDDKVKRLMDHTNIDEATAQNALEKNNNNVLDAFAYLEKEKLIDKKLSHKQVNHDKNYVEYDEGYRYMDEKVMGNSPVYPNPFRNEQNNKNQNVSKEFDYSFNVDHNPSYGHYDTKTAGYVNPEKYKEYTNPDFKMLGNQMTSGFKGAINYLVSNKLVIMRKNNAMISVPIILAIIIVLLLSHWFPIIIAVFFVSLILGFRYFIESPDDNKNNNYDNSQHQKQNQYGATRSTKQTYGRQAPYQNHNVQQEEPKDEPFKSVTMDKKEYYEKMEDYAGGTNILNTEILRKQIHDAAEKEISVTTAENSMEKAIEDLEIKAEKLSEKLEENIINLEEELDKMLEEEEK